ncbi:MAG: Bug family tripartite tricarboxylate transporter substrate binding protein [Burkholderiales bacterium]
MTLSKNRAFSLPMLCCVISGAMSAIVGGPALAQVWPDRTVRVVVPFGAGGGTDIQGRLLGQKFYQSMGQTFVIDNRPGAAGLIGAEAVANAAPDGYTVLFTTASLSVNVTLYRKTLAFDPVKDLQPVSWVSSVPLVLVVHPSVPARSVKELLALARAKPVNAGSNGAGTTSYLAVEMLKQYTGVDVVNVPYKGGGPTMNALLGGEVDFAFATALTAAPHIKSGKVRGLAVTTAKPSKAFPDLPSLAATYEGFDVDNWYAIFVPAGTPKPIVEKLNAEIRKALNLPDVQEFMAKEGGEPVGSSPAELEAMFTREVGKYARVIQKAHLAAN